MNLHLLQEIAGKVTDAASVGHALRTAIEAVCSHTGWPVGRALLSEPDGSPAPDADIWYAVEPGLLAQCQELAQAREQAIATDPGRASGAENLHVACAVPVLIGAEATAVLEFYDTSARSLDPDLLDQLCLVGRHLGLVIACKRTEIEMRRVEVERRWASREYQDLLNAVHDAVVVFRLEDGRILESNAAANDAFGLHRRDCGPASMKALVDGCRMALEAPDGTPGRFEITHKLPGTQERLFEVTASLATHSGTQAIFSVCRDVTDRKRAAQALRESEERYVLAAQGAHDGLWDWDLLHNRVFFSPRWKAILGYEKEELSDSPNEWFVRVHPEDVKSLMQAINEHTRGTSPHFEVDHRVLHRDGTYRWVRTRGMAVRDTEGTAYRMAGSLAEITGQRSAEEELRRRAFHDALTDLPNRTFFLERLWRAVECVKRRPSYLFAVLFIDLDRFKVINDSLGHTIGDQLLVAIARRLDRCVGRNDMVARIGGDEFAVVLEFMLDAREAQSVAERIQQEMRRPYDISGHQIVASASIGIALSTNNYERPEDLLREADLAMYRAKADGHGRYVVFDAELHAKAVALVHLENDLRWAAERGELEAYYQPIVALGDQRITGFEAVVRWHHPTRGLIPPNEFIPLAEETGLVTLIDEWMLGEACQQVHAWHEEFDLQGALTMSVNLSCREFTQMNLAEIVDATIERTGIDPGSLKLEITETALIQNAEVANGILSQLKDRGVKLLIDDFGTGYSSLSYLHRFPFDLLKIDRSFVSGERTLEGRYLEIVRAIIGLAHSLGLDVIAEGIDTQASLETLQTLGCGYGQGYLFAKPVDAATARRLLVAQTRGAAWEAVLG